MVKIHPNSFFEPESACAFISDVTLSDDESIQSCIWQCVHEHSCQTAVYYENDKLCSMFNERCENGQIQSADNDLSSVICYRKNHSKNQ